MVSVRKVRANALFIVLAVAMVISLFTGSLIMLAYHHRIRVVQSQLAKRLDANAASGIQLLLSDSYSLDNTSSKTIDLFDLGNDSVCLKKMTWGVYEIGVSNAFSQKDTVTKMIQFGFETDSLSNTALYLTDLGNALSIVGNTSINGNAYLPASGVRRGYMEGESFTGDQMINGSVKQSAKQIPPLNKAHLNNLLNYFKPGELFKQDCIVETDISKDSLIRSFRDTTLLIQFSGSREINSVLRGNIILYSTADITLDASARLTDIIIYASSVRIKSGFTGNLQIFCTDSIIIEDNCVFNYPSALGVLKMDYKTTQPYIAIGNQTIIQGILLSYQYVTDQKQTRISLANTSLVEGEVYADGFVEADGTVYGNITCNKFLLHTNSGVYENYLFNTVVYFNKRSSHYVGSGINSSGNSRKLIKWLN